MWFSRVVLEHFQTKLLTFTQYSTVNDVALGSQRILTTCLVQALLNFCSHSTRQKIVVKSSFIFFQRHNTIISCSLPFDHRSSNRSSLTQRKIGQPGPAYQFSETRPRLVSSSYLLFQYVVLSRIYRSRSPRLLTSALPFVFHDHEPSTGLQTPRRKTIVETMHNVVKPIPHLE